MVSKEAGKTAVDLYVIEKVKEKRNGLGMSQAVLAAKLEISNGYIGNIESANYPHRYNLNQINELAKIFKCSPRDFLPENPM
jgi:transcriptional regulator with XRE-family HTH domain